jgi:hypothetical protein
MILKITLDYAIPCMFIAKMRLKSHRYLLHMFPHSFELRSIIIIIITNGLVI